MAKASATGIPAGFKKVESGSFPPNHDFKKEPVLTGIVHSIRSVPQKRGKKTEPVGVMHVADKVTGEICAVWESSALEELFKTAKPGNAVYIKSEGVQKLKGKKTLKKFTVAIGPGK
jgi:hypothetical protein